MSELMLLAGSASRPAEPGSGSALRRWLQDAALAALVPSNIDAYAYARRSLASFASGAPET